MSRLQTTHFSSASLPTRTCVTQKAAAASTVEIPPGHSLPLVMGKGKPGNGFLHQLLGVLGGLQTPGQALGLHRVGLFLADVQIGFSLLSLDTGRDSDGEMTEGTWGTTRFS